MSRHIKRRDRRTQRRRQTARYRPEMRVGQRSVGGRCRYVRLGIRRTRIA